MDVFSQYSSESESGAMHLSDEGILLASRNPKKRAGRKKFKETRHPVYWGVRRKKSGKWICEVREPNKQSRIWLGTFPTAEMAARAHDVAAIALRGNSACLNFADSAWRLPVPASGTAKDIQRTAAEAAELFRPCGDGCGGETAVGERFFHGRGGRLRDAGLLVNMAEGMLLPPPLCVGDDDGYGGDDMEAHADVSLWSYSI
uniref:Birch protein n=1 Tax=Betula platyphylla TaxID=78630 RepID=A0A9E9L5T6_BETPL|nr:birch protein [Betula platyphylla]